MGNLPTVEVARWDYLARKYPKTKTYVSLAPDDESGRDSARAMMSALTKYGKECIDEIYFPRETTDFSSIATRIKSTNPDFVIFPADAGETDFGLKQKALYEAGYRGIRVAEFFHADVVKTVTTNEQVEGVIAPVVQSDLPPEKRNEASVLMEKLYRDKYGTFITTGLTWMKQLYALLAAIEKADSLDVDDVYAACAGLEFMHAEGMGLVVRRPDLGVNRYCDTVVSYDLGVVRDGKVVYDESVTIPQMLEALEKVFGGGSWR
jgi:ABC-type branched-subunit amino acid transport system substrate-binding protein